MHATIEEIRSLRRDRRFDEACEQAHMLIADDEEDADAWWNLALAQHSLGDLEESLRSLKMLIKLAHGFASGWAQYGVVLAENGQAEHGLKALSRALQLDPRQAVAARQAARICNEQNDVDGEIRYLSKLDAIGEADGNDLLRLGIAYWSKKHFGKAIDSYHRSAAIQKSVAPYFNLALVYSHDEVSQDVDAIDCLERALHINPEHEASTKRLSQIKPRLDKLAQDVLQAGETGLTKEYWYQFYINPFELLDANRDERIEDYDTKRIQRLKRRLLQEIELEDGYLDYADGLMIDKSQAIGICEELNDERLKMYHWFVFTEPYLLGFLTRGEIRHFLCLDDYNPIDLLEELDSEWSGFREWLSKTFCRQYDLLLTRALQNKRVPLVESLFDGRRWILSEHEELCYEGARRQVEELLNPLRQAAERAKNAKPSKSQVNDTLNHSGLISIINLLPEPFRDQQTEAVSLVRDIAITAFNEHSDTDLSKNILTLSRQFSFKNASLTQKLAEDSKQIERIIAQERQHEKKLTLGKDRIEVTKYGVQQGDTFISAGTAATIRWGVMITGTQYRQVYHFLMVCRDNAGNETKFSWQSSRNIEKQQDYFAGLVNAALNYVVPKICEKVQNRLDSGEWVKIGPCSLGKAVLMFEKSVWFTTKQYLIPWNRVETRIDNGVLYVYDRSNPKACAEMKLRDTENAAILQFLAVIL
ncbi:tetratricopeptide repeat protein, partial [Candidatus Bathyarchaeota archaeon]|nr:tetratricopeptide repeat protein [Candidatus Bathyarchaeota archaeon]